MISLINILSHLDLDSPHHRAAIFELERHIPKEQMDRDAEWICIFNGGENQLTYNEYIAPQKSELKKPRNR